MANKNRIQKNVEEEFRYLTKNRNMKNIKDIDNFIYNLLWSQDHMFNFLSHADSRGYRIVLSFYISCFVFSFHTFVYLPFQSLPFSFPHKS